MIVFGLTQWPNLRRAWLPGALHGSLGIAGTALLLFALQEPTRGTRSGAASFGTLAAILLATAILLGGIFALSRYRRRAPAMLLIGIHATLAVTALVLLAAYLSVPE